MRFVIAPHKDKDLYRAHPSTRKLPSGPPLMKPTRKPTRILRSHIMSDVRLGLLFPLAHHAAHAVCGKKPNQKKQEELQSETPTGWSNYTQPETQALPGKSQPIPPLNP
jgi:hypothetical protein